MLKQWPANSLLSSCIMYIPYLRQINYVFIIEEIFMNYSRITTGRLMFAIDKIQFCCNFATEKSMSEFQVKNLAK